MRDVARAATPPKIVLPLVILAGWVVALVAVAANVGLWSNDRTTDTVVWFVTAGVVLFARFDRVSKEPHFVRRSAIATLKFGAIVQALSELFVLNLVAEVVLQPFVALFACLSIVAAQKDEHRQVKQFVDSVMSTTGIALMLYVAVSVVNNWHALDKAGIGQQVALPIWLTVGVLPYIFLVGLFSAYELAFIRVFWRSEASRWSRARAKLVLALSFHVKAREVGAFAGPWQLRLAETTSFREARRVVADFRQQRGGAPTSST